MAARYLIRFDDICPTMNWVVWRGVEKVLLEEGVKPLLAVVPDNQDPELRVAPAEARFWDEVRLWQERGWTIGLHGWRHQYVTGSSGVIGRNPYSEFAGLSEEVQEWKIARALEIFRKEQVEPLAWVAPGHSFDLTTVQVLARQGVKAISDGYALRPYRCPDGLVWAPQQLGRFHRMPWGVWTICLHFNGWAHCDWRDFARNLHEFRHQISTFEEILAEGGRREADWTDSLFFLSFRALRWLKG